MFAPPGIRGTVLQGVGSAICCYSKVSLFLHLMEPFCKSKNAQNAFNKLRALHNHYRSRLEIHGSFEHMSR